MFGLYRSHKIQQVRKCFGYFIHCILNNNIAFLTSQGKMTHKFKSYQIRNPIKMVYDIIALGHPALISVYIYRLHAWLDSIKSIKRD